MLIELFVIYTRARTGKSEDVPHDRVKVVRVTISRQRFLLTRIFLITKQYWVTVSKELVFAEIHCVHLNEFLIGHYLKYDSM